MDPKDLKLELTVQEKERRWSLLREKMVQEGLSAVVVYATIIPIPENACRYFTNMEIQASCQHVLLFPAVGEPILLISVNTNTYFAKKTSWVTAENICKAGNMGKDLAKHLLALKLQDKRIGINSPGEWPIDICQPMREACSGAELVDATELLSRIRAPKSSEELGVMRKAIRIGELVQRTFLANLRPGMREEETVAKVEELVRANGVERRHWLISSTPEIAYPWLAGETIVRKPNPVSYSSEFTRTRGYACQVVRTYCWEEPKGEYKEMWQLWRELRQMASQDLRPGREVAELAAKTEKLVRESGFECDYIGHGIGINYAEVPYVGVQTRWTIMPNEVYVFHPMVRRKGGTGPLAWAGDMYLVKEDGTEWMTPFLPGLPEIIPG